jgi:hypothetical protein
MTIFRSAALGVVLGYGLGACAQDAVPERPLPDVSTLMRQVEKKQRADEMVEKDYIYRQTTRFEELDGHGKVKKVVSKEFDIFWLDGVNVRRLVKKDGKDLSADEQKKESERIDKEVAKGRKRREKGDANGKETDSNGHEEVTVARILELGRFTNERRIVMDGRDTIVVDYTGDPKAKTHNAAENAIKDVAGTVWVDEQDKSVAKLEGRMMDNFKVGGGLLLNVHKDARFSLQNRKINQEAWLPSTFEAHGQARYLLFDSLNGNVEARASDYRKFKATSTLLPDGSGGDASAVPKP